MHLLIDRLQLNISVLIKFLNKPDKSFANKYLMGNYLTQFESEGNKVDHSL